MGFGSVVQYICRGFVEVVEVGISDIVGMEAIGLEKHRAKLRLEVSVECAKSRRCGVKSEGRPLKVRRTFFRWSGRED